jgi:PAS domain S-box-containing protein
MYQPLRVLMVEDSEDDARLLLRVLRRGGYEPVYAIVDTPSTMRAALKSQEWDVITFDNAMPHFSAPKALALAKKLRPDLPFIIVSGAIDLNLVVSLMKEGAQDYIQKKTELPRLVPAIRRGLDEAKIRREHQQIRNALEISETRYRRLFETAQDGILILDAETGQITDVNPFLLKILGYSHEDLLGKKLWEIGTFRDIEASKATSLELKSKGYVRYHDLPLETKDGRPIAVEFVSNVYLVNHHKVIQCNIRDTTERKLNAEALQKSHNELEQQSVKLQAALSEISTLKEQLEAENIYLRQERKSRSRYDHIIGQSDGLKYVLYRAEQVAPQKTTVLILGETGTGKELIAFAIHDMSPHKGRPLITVNCAALPGNLIESELFGREKGAFTGADNRQITRPIFLRTLTIKRRYKQDLIRYACYMNKRGFVYFNFR